MRVRQDDFHGLHSGSLLEHPKTTARAGVTEPWKSIWGHRASALQSPFPTCGSNRRWCPLLEFRCNPIRPFLDERAVPRLNRIRRHEDVIRNEMGFNPAFQLVFGRAAVLVQERFEIRARIRFRE